MRKKYEKVTGYLVDDSVMPGETVQVAVDSQGREFSARLVRIDGPTDDFTEAPWWRATAIEHCEVVRHPGTQQRTLAGSYGCSEPVEGVIGPQGGAVTMWLWPGLTGIEMTLLSQVWEQEEAGFRLSLTASGHVAFSHWAGGRKVEIQSAAAIMPKHWQAVAISLDPGAKTIDLWLAKESRSKGISVVDRQHVSAEWLPLPPTRRAVGLGATIHATGEADGDSFEGKVDRPRLWGSPLEGDQLHAWLLEGGTDPPPLIEWFFGPAAGATAGDALVPNRGPGGAELVLVNRPEVCVTGHTWSGRSTDVRLDPKEYSAVRLHRDDLDDARWKISCELVVPPALKSGIYGVELKCREEQDVIPLFVRPPDDSSARSEVLYIAPTMTYLAYGNDRQHTYVDFGGMTEARPNGPYEDWIEAHPAVGSSLYDLHPDGSGWSYSAKRRPLGNVRPDYVSWITGSPRHFSGDLAITSWLDHEGIAFDVITDHDLHQYGEAVLQPYRAVVTGSHPEYVSGEMLDALDGYLSNDGRLIYLGGNGFYWVTGVAADGSIEVRRGHAGTRAWESLPGEDVLAVSLEPGGLWRHRGRAPNALVGVGFAAQGWTGGAAFVIAGDIPADLHALVFGDRPGGALVGDFGTLGGAAGDEVDRFDPTLGSPDTTVVLASSAPFTDDFQPAVEDQPTLTPQIGGATNGDVRADMTYVQHEDGGAVFSVGSINWASCLPFDQFENNVAWVSTNVLRSFIEGSM